MRRKYLIPLVIFILSSICISHALVDLKDADFSQIEIGLAGPDSIYVRSVKIGEKFYSLVLTLEDKEVSTVGISNSVAEDKNVLSQSINLTFADIRAIDSRTIEISGILINNQPYAGRFQFDGDKNLTRTDFYAQNTFPEGVEQKINSLVAIVPQSKWSQLESENEILKTKVQTLTAANSSLEKTSASLKEENQQLKYLESETNVLKARLLSLTKENTTLKSQQENLQQLNAQIATLTTENQQLLVSQEEEKKLVLALDDANQRLADENQALKKETIDLKKQLETLKKFPGLKDVQPLFTKVIHEGFEEGIQHIGTWEIRQGVALQTDPSKYFAELIFEVPQSQKQTLFSFSARATGNGWVGFGLHLFVSDNLRKKGYGLGNSLLVWLTRDPQTYDNSATYLQLYRSYGPVWMERVLDAKIEESISDYMKVEILYDPSLEYITVTVDDTEKVRYKTWFDIQTGMEIALRTLREGISFKDLLVMTTD